MRRQLTIAALMLLLVFLAAAPPAANGQGISVYFSPNGGCTDAIVARIAAAKKTIDLQAYSFTSSALAKALTEAHGRGVKVRAVLDDSNQTDKYSSATFLANHGVPVYVDGKHAIAHNKLMIIDGATIITGSFNFSRAAEERNAENLLIIDGKPKLVAAYQRNFEQHLAHSKAYERK